MVLTNPIKDELKINVKSPEDKNISIRVISASGTVLLSKQQLISNGENNLVLPANHLPKGLVIISIKDLDNNKQPLIIKVLKN